MEVHRHLGPGLLESAYETCLAHELQAAGLKVQTQKPLPLIYKNVKLDCGYRLDMMVEDRLVIEIKSVARIEPIHVAQVLSYLKLSGCRLGLLLNFNVQLLKDGIRRLIHD